MFPSGLQTANIFAGPDLLIVVGLMVLLFGGKKIPELAKGLGEGIKNFKDAVKPNDPPPPAATTEETRTAEEIRK